MTNYSAAQAISPAIERTKEFLFRPFTPGRFFKLTLVAAITEAGSSGLNFGSSVPSRHTDTKSMPFELPHQFPHFAPQPALMLALLIGTVLIVGFALAILISYLVIRLRFAYFDCVVRRQDKIAPAWGRYHRQAMRYLGMSLCVGVVFLMIAAIAGYQIFTHFKSLFESIGSATPPDFSDFLPVLAMVIPLAVLLGLASFLVETAMNTFILPHMALDDATIGDALSDVWEDIVAEPGQFSLFVLLRILLSIVAGILGAMVLLIPFAFVVGFAALVIGLLTLASKVLAIVIGIAIGVLVLGLFLYASVGIGGTVGTFQRNYGLLFYGSRYPSLGNLLEPPLPAPPAPIPPWQPSPYPGAQPGS